MQSKLICVVLIAALFAVSCCGELFNPKRLNFIDYSSIGNNWLFRGNQPTNSSKQFPYELLVETMRQKATLQANKTLPSTFYLMDLSFESFERGDIDLEKDFFAKNPTLGNYTEWILIGDLTAPADYPSDVMKLMAEDLADWQIDRLTERLPRLKKILDTPGPNGLPIVIYIHWFTLYDRNYSVVAESLTLMIQNEAGSDRTGEFSGSYYLQFQGAFCGRCNCRTPHRETKRPRITVVGRNGKKEQLRAAVALCIESETGARACLEYCYYLQYKLNYNVDCTAPTNSTPIAIPIAIA